MTLRKTLALVRHLRARDPDTPYVLMGYYNPIYRYGAEAFAKDAAAAGVDGLIIVDLPPEEERELADPAQAAGLDLVRLATPTSDEQRLPMIVERASGFVYYVAIAGITGTRSADAASVRTAVTRIRRFTPLPIACRIRHQESGAGRRDRPRRRRRGGRHRARRPAGAKPRRRRQGQARPRRRRARRHRRARQGRTERARMIDHVTFWGH